MLTIAAISRSGMYHDAAPPRPAKADPRPPSAVSTGTGLAGLAGLLGWTAYAKAMGMDGPYAALVNVAACGVPMVLWAVLVDKVHRNASTGMDWAHPRPWRETIDISLTRLAGLWLTFAGIALLYFVGRYYSQGVFAFSMWCFQVAAPWLFVASIPYVLWTDRHAVNPRDGTWHLGAWIMNLDESVDRDAIFRHLRAWGVKAFFLPFMLGIVPGGFGDFVRTSASEAFADPVRLANWLITFMFTIDVAFATVGYALTLRPLDAHIRSANPYASAWMAALICYPPFILMGDGGPLDYHPGTSDWNNWFAGYPLLLWSIGAALVALTAIYAWATVAFGFRFSNLTHRGILTHGPYAITRHPAYLSKNIFWWIATLPMLTTTGSWVDGVRNTILMAAVSGIYYWRARTEERHLGADPAYRDYFDWMERNAPVPRLFARLTGRARAPMQPLA
jgi:protein-S-isoprenylcysteine O-methyltransferase Ste14